jgi:hypothetical protein
MNAPPAVALDLNSVTPITLCKSDAAMSAALRQRSLKVAETLGNEIADAVVPNALHPTS